MMLQPQKGKKKLAVTEMAAIVSKKRQTMPCFHVQGKPQVGEQDRIRAALDMTGQGHGREPGPRYLRVAEKRA